MKDRITICEASSSSEIASVLTVLRGLELWLHRNGAEVCPELASHVRSAEWVSELSDLKGHYGDPFGAIVLARVGCVAAGCLLMRGISEDTCEIRLNFVRPAYSKMSLLPKMHDLASRLATERGYRYLKSCQSLAQAPATRHAGQCDTPLLEYAA